MCGRFGLFVSKADMSDRFDAEISFAYERRYNIAPRDNIATIRNSDQDHIVEQEWGFLPHWADTLDDEPRPINARTESVAENNMFTDALQNRRCLVPSNGFYEWRGERGSKQPYRVHLVDNDLFVMAGLWNRYEHDDETLETVAILTTEPNKIMAPIHDRMPVVLERDDEDTWLNAGADKALAVCGPYAGGDMATYELTTTVNNPDNEDEEIVQPIGSEQRRIDDL